MGIDNVIPNGYQMQSLIDRPLPLRQMDATLTIKSTPAVGTVTVQSSAAVELKIGSTPLASRSQIVVRNPSVDTAVRIGPSGITTKKGFILEPLGTVTIKQDPETAVAIYARSMGWEVSLEVIES